MLHLSGAIYQSAKVEVVDRNLSAFVMSAVPELASWAQMIAGFALAGVAARRRQRMAAGSA